MGCREPTTRTAPTTQSREVPDGNGGTTAWTANPDGSNTVRYPDGTIYEEPGTRGKGYTEAVPTTQPDGSTGLDTTYQSPDGNTYTANTQWNDNGTISTIGTSPEGNYSSTSKSAPSANVINTGNTPEGNDIVTRSQGNPDGTVSTYEIDSVTHDDFGRPIYHQKDGTTWAPDAGNGTSMEVVTEPNGDKIITLSNEESARIYENGNVDWKPTDDYPGSILAGILAGMESGAGESSRTTTPGRHALNAAEAARVSKWVGRFGRVKGPIGNAATIGSAGTDIANGASIPETVGSAGGSMVGGTLGGVVGAGAGFSLGLAGSAMTGAAIGSALPIVGTAVGALVGTGVRAFVGSHYGSSIGNSARKVWNSIFG